MGWVTHNGQRFYKDDSTGLLKKDVFGNPHNSKYDIKRFYHPSLGSKTPRYIMRNVSPEVAHAHVNDPKTRKEGHYFDGFERSN